MIVHNQSVVFDKATAVGSAIISTNKSDIVSIQVEGTFAATITLEARLWKGDSWHEMSCVNLGNFSVLQSITEPGIYELGVEGIHELRAKIKSYTSGEVTVRTQSVESSI